MNKLRFYITFLLSAMLLYSKAQITPVTQMEHLNRGVVALPANSGRGIFVSWRFLGTDDSTTRFDLIKNGTTIASDLEVSNYTDASGDSSSEYQVITKVNGEIVSTSDPVKAWGEVYKKLKLDRPANAKTKPYRTTNTVNKQTVEENYPDGQEYSYSPNDISVGDVDGDGEYELFVKWDPSNSRDNSFSGVTGIVYIDCYKLDGTKLWRIDLGQNIRAGAHYTQFQVYDYDGDGKVEMICKTAPGSKDGLGNYVNQAATNETIKAASNTKDWVTNNSGRINGGHEYLTVFNGETGAAIHTIAYYPNRNAKPELSEAAGTYNWDDRSGKNDKGDYGNRGERYLAATAYLDGPDHNPSGIFCRGYYTFAHIWAVDFDGQQLKTRWLHSSDSRTTYKWMIPDEGNSQRLTSKTLKGNTCYSGLNRYTMYANGNHNMSIADVDGMATLSTWATLIQIVPDWKYLRFMKKRVPTHGTCTMLLQVRSCSKEVLKVSTMDEACAPNSIPSIAEPISHLRQNVSNAVRPLARLPALYKLQSIFAFTGMETYRRNYSTVRK